MSGKASFVAREGVELRDAARSDSHRGEDAVTDSAGSCPAFDRYAAAEEAAKRAHEELLASFGCVGCELAIDAVEYETRQWRIGRAPRVYGGWRRGGKWLFAKVGRSVLLRGEVVREERFSDGHGYTAVIVSTDPGDEQTRLLFVILNEKMVMT